MAACRFTASACKNAKDFVTYALDFWAGVFAPSGTPPAIVARLNAAINANLQTEVAKANLKKTRLRCKGRIVARILCVHRGRNSAMNRYREINRRQRH